jgi:hypothetical protein
MNKKFNEERRDKQIIFLDQCDTQESLGRSSRYLITVDETGENESCACAGTASMLLETKYKNINIWVKKLV